jgi:hypothetical protein
MSWRRARIHTWTEHEICHCRLAILLAGSRGRISCLWRRYHASQPRAGPARAAEFLLSGRDFTGVEAERYGLINRALPTDELGAYVDTLAKSIARRSHAVLAMHRAVSQRVFSMAVEPLFAAFAAENDGLRAGLAGTEMRAGMAAMLALKQTRENELDLPATMDRIHSAGRK